MLDIMNEIRCIILCVDFENQRLECRSEKRRDCIKTPYACYNYRNN